MIEIPESSSEGGHAGDLGAVVAGSESTRGISIRISPAGTILLSSAEAFREPLPGPVAEAIEGAFARGAGHGLLLLGADLHSADLGPTLGFWRGFSKLCLTRICGLIDLEEQVRDGLRIPLGAREFGDFVAAAPPMLGIEYLSAEVLETAWMALQAAFTEEVRASGRTAESYLEARGPLWKAVGRVFFHLAENKARPDLPFAFLATYTSRISSTGKLQHVPLGKALKEHAAAANKAALLSLLVPVRRAAEASPFLKDLVDSGRIFQTLAWGPAEAHRFLREVERFEENGIYVRVPDWWNPRSPPRVRLEAKVGTDSPAHLGAGALLDFSVALALDGEPLTEEEWREILAGSGGLRLVKGRWVEVDREKLADLLQHWRKVEKAASRGGISFLEGMRLLAGIPEDRTTDLLGRPSAADPASEWVRVDAGPWLEGILAQLRGPDRIEASLPAEELGTTLRPYQGAGVRWLWLLHELRLGGCLADDMGLGKTVQVLALLLMLRRKGPRGSPSLLVLPASLIGNWKSECARFAPSLDVLVAHPSESGGPLEAMPEKLSAADLVITTYGMVARVPWLLDTEWRVVILDEAQAIKNPGARQTRVVKSLKCLHRLALTGTPVENSLLDLWSIFDFLSPGLLGTAKSFAKATSRSDRSALEVYSRVRSLVRPYILRRLKTDRRIISDLPDKEEVKVYCGLQRKQAVLYEAAVRDLEKALEDIDGIHRRGVILSYLLRFKQICNHPAQSMGTGAYDPAESGKTLRLMELCDEIASRQEKVLVFTQFREITRMLSHVLETVFGAPGLVLDGDTPVKKRKDLVDEFQRDEGPPHFVLSLKAGGSGLNLTAASHVIHFDRWWNPAVENQATDRAFRIGQRKSVLVHKFICRGTVEERIDGLLESKKEISDEVLRDGAEAVLTEMGNEELMRFVSLDRRNAVVES